MTFERKEFLTARAVALDDAAGVEAPLSQAAYRNIEHTLRSRPGIVNVTYASELPGAIEPAWCWLELATPDVAAGAVSESDRGSHCQRVGSNYFETIGVPLVDGRPFTESEIAGNHPVAIVDETFVRLILGGRRAVGLMIREPRREPGDAPGPGTKSSASSKT